MEREPGRRWIRLLLIAILMVVAGGAAAAWFVQSPAVDAFLLRQLPYWAQKAGLRLELGSIDLDPWQVSVSVKRLRVERVRGDWSVEAERVSVGLDLARSLAGTLHLRVEADAPRFRGDVHLAQKSSFKMPKLALDRVRVTEGAFSVTDLDSGLTFSIPEIELRWLGRSGWGRAVGGGARWKGAEEHLREISVVGSRRFGILTIQQARLSSDRLSVTGRGRMGLQHLLDGTVDLQLLARNLPEAWEDALGLGDYRPVDGALAVRGRVTGRLEEPRFHGAATLSSGGFGPLSFRGGTCTLEATDKELGFAKLGLQTAAGSARGVSGTLSWARGLALHARGEAVDYDLRPFMALFVRGYFPVGLKASGTFEAKGTLYPKLDLACRANASGRELDVTTLEDDGATTWFSLPRGKVNANCRVAKDHLVFGPTVVDGGTVVVRMPSGRIDYEKGLDFDTDVEITNLDLVRQYLPEERGPIDTRGRAHGRMRGPYEALTFDYRLDLDATTLWGRPMGALTADASFDLRDLVLKKSALRGPMGRVDASGRATLRTGGPITLDAVWSGGDLSATAALIHTVAPAFPEDVRGLASAVGRVVGTIDEPVFEGSVTAGDVRLFGAKLDEVKGEGALGLTSWKLDRLALAAYGATVVARGRADLDAFEVEGRANGLSLLKLDTLFGKPMPVGAVFTGSFHGRGPYADPVAELSGAFSQGEVTGYALGGGSVTGELKNRELVLDVRAFSGAGRASVRIGLEGPRPLAVDAVARDVPWKLVPPGLVPQILQGESASGSGRVVGALSEGGE